MPAILYLFRFIRLLGSGHETLTVENAALRLQLAAFRRKRQRPILTSFDRLFWVGLRQLWSGWRGALVFVQPIPWFDGIASGSASSGHGFRGTAVAEKLA